MNRTTYFAGFGKLKITPPFGCEMSGFVARNGGSLGVHDPLWARALVISDGISKIGLVSVDLIGIDRETVAEARLKVAQLTDIPPEQVVISATHTHSGPATLRQGYLGKPDPHYLSILIDNMAGAVYLANQALEPVQLSIGEGCCSIGKNRRCPGGPTDPGVSVLRVNHNQGQQVLLVNYPCHPVVLGATNRLITADYPYYLIYWLEQLYPGSEIIFINGAAGDINVGHSAAESITAPAGSKRTFTEAARLGKILAAQVVTAVETGKKLPVTGLKFKNSEIELSLDQVTTPENYQAMAEEYLQSLQGLKKSGISFGELRQLEVWAEWAQAMKDKAKEVIHPFITTEVAAFAIGDSQWVTFPGEFFHEFGLMIKRLIPDKPVFILGYTNDSLGYVVPSEAYLEGGYEVNDAYRYYGLPSRLARGTGERVVEALADLISHNT